MRVPRKNIIKDGKKNFIFLLTSFLCFFFLGANEAKIFFDPVPLTSDHSDQIKVGDLVRFKVIQSENQTLTFIGEKLEEQGLVLRPVSDIPSAFAVVPIRPGKLVLPSLIVKDSVSGKVVGKTKPVDLEVNSGISKDDLRSKEPAEPIAPLSLSFPYMLLMIVFILFIIVLVLFFLILLRWIKKRKSRFILPNKKEFLNNYTEDEIALIHLLNLENENLLNVGKHKQYYFRISEILKAYIGARYGFDALESTTQEILKTMKKEISIDDMSALFEKLDQVKFTDYIPDLYESVSILEQARAWIRKTARPKETDREKEKVLSYASS